MCGYVCLRMANDFSSADGRWASASQQTEKTTNVNNKVTRDIGLTKTSSAAASGNALGCGFEGFSHVKTGQYDGSPSAAAIG